MTKYAQYTALLNDVDVKRWYNNNLRGSKAGADNYLRCLGKFEKDTGISPKALRDMPVEQRNAFWNDYVTENPRGRTVLVQKVLRSWLNVFALQLPKLKLGRDLKPRIAKMNIPIPEQVRLVLAHADVRAKAAIAILAFGGQRLLVLGNHTGEDGLVLSDFKDLIISEVPDPEDPGKTISDVRWNQKPALLEIRETLNKVGTPFVTFLGFEACEYVLKYLHTRIAAGERLTPDSPFLVPTQKNRAMALVRRQNNPKRRFIRTINVADIVRRPMVASGIMQGNSPNIFRSYFMSQAELAPVQRAWVDYWVGHSGDMNAVYGLRKKMPMEKIDEMRKSFKKLLPVIETRNRENAEAAPESVPKSDRKQDVVDLAELKERIAHSWILVTNLPDGTYVVQR